MLVFLFGFCHVQYYTANQLENKKSAVFKSIEQFRAWLNFTFGALFCSKSKTAIF